MPELKNNKWESFMEFVNWYMKQGGDPLTPEEIERTYVKF